MLFNKKETTTNKKVEYCAKPREGKPNHYDDSPEKRRTEKIYAGAQKRLRFRHGAAVPGQRPDHPPGF